MFIRRRGHTSLLAAACPSVLPLLSLRTVPGSTSRKLPERRSQASLLVTPTPSAPIPFAPRNLVSLFLLQILPASGSLTSKLFKALGCESRRTAPAGPRLTPVPRPSDFRREKGTPFGQVKRDFPAKGKAGPPHGHSMSMCCRVRPVRCRGSRAVVAAGPEETRRGPDPDGAKGP